MTDANKQQTLSLCMIVKNEEQWLQQCLSSVKDLVQEMIIVDTGSSDSTIEIAKSFGAKVFEMKWENDFSKARNFSLEKATQDWILVLDADEAVDPADHIPIRQLIQNASHRLYFLTQTTYLDSSFVLGWVPNHLKSPLAKGYSGYVDSPLVRLMKNSRDILFKGNVHEHAHDLSHPEIQPPFTNIRIHHFGKYISAERAKNKEEFYLELTREKCKNEPQNFHAYYELGVQLMVLKKYSEAENYFKKAIELNSKYVRPYLALAGLYQNEDKVNEAIEILKDAIKVDPLELLTYVHLPNLLAKVGQIDAAEKMFQLCEPLLKGFPLYWANYGTYFLEIGNVKKAFPILLKACEMNPQDTLANTNLGVAYEMQAQDELAKKHYVQAYEHDSEPSFILDKLIVFDFDRKNFGDCLKWIELKESRCGWSYENSYRKALVKKMLGSTTEAYEMFNQLKNLQAPNETILKNVNWQLSV